MIINIKDTVTLDDNNEYIVVSKINFEKKNYYYLLDINNNSNVKFCQEDGTALVELEDGEFISKLIPLFLEVSKKELDEN